MSEGTETLIHAARAAAGFTLVELLVVLLLGAILVGLGVPAMQNMIAANQLNAMADGFASALNSARSEAGKLGANVILTATPAGVDWGAGWTMTVTTVDPITGNLTTSTLRTGAPVPAPYTFKSGPTFAGSPGISFDPTGRLTGAAGPDGFILCQGGGPAAGGASRLIAVAVSGRVRIAQNNASGVPIGDTGVVGGCTLP